MDPWTKIPVAAKPAEIISEVCRTVFGKISKFLVICIEFVGERLRLADNSTLNCLSFELTFSPNY